MDAELGSPVGMQSRLAGIGSDSKPLNARDVGLKLSKWGG